MPAKLASTAGEIERQHTSIVKVLLDRSPALESHLNWLFARQCQGLDYPEIAADFTRKDVSETVRIDGATRLQPK